MVTLERALVISYRLSNHSAAICRRMSDTQINMGVGVGQNVGGRD